MAGKDPDWLTRRLYDEITSAQKDPKNKYPTWKVMAQLVKDPSMSPVNIFDATKILPEALVSMERIRQDHLDGMSP